MAVVPRNRENIFLADCLSTDGEGRMVYITGPDVAGRFQVATVDPTDFGKMPAVAMIIQKPSPNAIECWIQFRGLVGSVYSGLTPGELLFVDDTGGLSDVPPEPTVGNPYKFMQSVGVALSANDIELRPNFVMAKRNY